MPRTKLQPPSKGGFDFSSPGNHPGWAKAVRPVRLYLDNSLRTWNELDEWARQNGYSETSLRQCLAWLENEHKIRSIRGKPYKLKQPKQTTKPRTGDEPPETSDVYWGSLIPLAVEEQRLDVQAQEEVG